MTSLRQRLLNRGLGLIETIQRKIDVAEVPISGNGVRVQLQTLAGLCGCFLKLPQDDVIYAQVQVGCAVPRIGLER